MHSHSEVSPIMLVFLSAENQPEKSRAHSSSFQTIFLQHHIPMGIIYLGQYFHHPLQQNFALLFHR